MHMNVPAPVIDMTYSPDQELDTPIQQHWNLFMKTVTTHPWSSARLFILLIIFIMSLSLLNGWKSWIGAVGTFVGLCGAFEKFHDVARIINEGPKPYNS